MNTAFALCAGLSAVFLLFGILFALLKEKAAVLISGFNTFTPKEREQYDGARLVRDMRNQFFLWSGILLAGAGLSLLISPYMAVPALLLWLVLFFSDVHLDPHKAFDRYLKK